MAYVCAGITYMEGETLVNSDICPPGCLAGNMGRDEWRKFLHDTLDEWLDNSGGTGHFIVGGEDVWNALNKAGER